ncbi:MAG TPA: hypothetical protein VFU69_17220 [Ktedonobacterales bacterium]|nr:hypothetical protein [Ktedonobacterales bacterium]
MSEQPVEHTPQPMPRPTTERAEELLARWEQQAKMLLADAGQRLRSTLAEAQTIRSQGSGQQGAPAAQPETSTEPSGEGAHPPSRPAPERAEAMLDEWGQRIGRSAVLAGQQLRKMAARAREEAEDILAEAQHIRQSASESSDQA